MSSRDIICFHMTASSCKLQPCRKWIVQYMIVFGLPQQLPGDFRSKWRHLRVTSGHLRSRHVISCHMTASSYELQRCRKWNVQCKPAFGLSQPLPGDFRSNVVTSKSVPVTWGDMTSFPFMWLPPPASCSLVGSEMYSICQFPALYSHFQVTSGQITSLPGYFRSPEVTWCHFLSRDCLLLRAKPCRKWNVQYMPVFSPLQPHPGDFRSNDVTYGSLLVTWGHLTPFPIM